MMLMRRILLLSAFVALVCTSLSYNAFVFNRSRSVVRHQTTLELRTLLKERVRVRKLSRRYPLHHQKNHPNHRRSAHGTPPVCP
jgi:hypothetical protein